MELVEDHVRVRAELLQSRQIGLPHVHYAEPNLFSLFLAKPSKEGFEALLAPIRSTKPDRSSRIEVTDHDSIPHLAEVYLVYANSRRIYFRSVIPFSDKIGFLERERRLVVDVVTPGSF